MRFISSFCLGVTFSVLLLYFFEEHTVAYKHGHDIGYKQGQIDALTGVIKYELVVHPDKTYTWEEKK